MQHCASFLGVSVLDVLRILPWPPRLKGEILAVSDARDTIYATTTLRPYNAFLDQWELLGMPQGSGLQNTGTGQRVGNEIHITQKTGSRDGVALMVRIRYYDIHADRFSWIADQSQDGGKTWAKESVRMEARRIGPARFRGRVRYNSRHDLTPNRLGL
jgi:hypothetical protein